MALSDLQKMVAGMFYPTPSQPGTSIYDLARADAQRQSLGSLGAGLLAAAVPQTPLMRAQALQQAFAGMGNMGTNVYNAAQARLMAQNAEASMSRAKAMSDFFSQSPQIDPAAAVTPVRDGGFQTNAQGIIASPPPPSVRVPGGLSPEQWAGVQQLSQIDPDKAMEVYSSLVKKNAGGDETVDTFGTVLYRTDPDTGLQQAILPKKGGGFVPIGAPGEIMDAASMAAAKARGTEEGRTSAQDTAGAPEVISQTRQSLQNINDVLQGDFIETAFGPVAGAITPESGAGIAYNTYTGGKFGDAVARINQIDSAAFAEGIRVFDGKGALSDAEGEVARGLKARLNRTQSPEAARTSLQEFQSTMQRASDRAELMLQINPNTGKLYTKAEAFLAVPVDSTLEDKYSQSANKKAQTTDAVPEGVDPEDWKYMTPEERKLWQK